VAGACTNAQCIVIGGSFGNNCFGGIGIIWSAFTRGESTIAAAIDVCTKCGRCKTVCPLEIDTPKMVETLKEMLVKKGYIEPRHREIKNSIEENRNLFSIKQMKK